MTSEDHALVVTLDEQAEPIGSMSKLLAHEAPGHRHLAFSVLLRDPAGRVLLQRRADSKYHFSGAWANSACSHPRPGEDLVASAVRCVREELGVEVDDLRPRTAFWYRAEDAASGLVEHEFDVVLHGELAAGTSLDPDPDEVADLRWLPSTHVMEQLETEGAAIAPWLPLVLEASRGPQQALPAWLGATDDGRRR